MPRRAGFRYQIDRRRSRKEQEKDEQEEAFLNQDDDDDGDDDDDDSPFDEGIVAEEEEDGSSEALVLSSSSGGGDNNEDDEDDDDDQEEDEVAAPARRAGRRSNVRRNSTALSWEPSNDDDDDDDDDDDGKEEEEEEDSAEAEIEEEEADHDEKKVSRSTSRSPARTTSSRKVTRSTNRIANTTTTKKKTAPKKRKKPPASKKRKTTRRNHDDDDDDESYVEEDESSSQEASDGDDEEADEDDEAVFVTNKRTRQGSGRKSTNNASNTRKSPAKKHPGRLRGKVAAVRARKFDEDESEEELKDEEEDDDEQEVDQEQELDYTPDGRRTRSSSSRAISSSKPSSSAGRPIIRGVHDSLADLPPPHRSSATIAKRRKVIRRPKAAKAGGRDQDVDSDEDDDDDDDDNKDGKQKVRDETLPALSTPRRSSALKAEQKLRRITAEEERGSDVEDLDTEEIKGSDDSKDLDVKRKAKPYTPTRRASATKRKMKRKVVADSDSEWSVDDSASDVEVDDSLSDVNEGHKNDERSVSDDDLSDTDRGEGNSRKALNVDNEEVGTADTDDDSNTDNVMKSRKSRKARTQAEILPSPRKGTFLDSDTSDDDDTTAKERGKSKDQRIKLPCCPSVNDAITHETLPKRHVCYIAPDGQSRQCFRLETLRQIALNSSQLQLRVDIDGERRNFLQPPHFRTAMSDDLVDQIASRFGRDALDLCGPYYSSKITREAAIAAAAEDDSADEDERAHNNDVYAFDTFRDRIKGYLRRMGSQDVYVCPLCYSQSHRSLVDPDSEDEDENVPTESIYDPLEVLGHLDSYGFEIASQFCFTKVVEVKQHLRDVHEVDTRGIEGNDLYMRFRVRASDGLLQRWIAHTEGDVKQGYMIMYWNEGNSQNYIHLLDLIQQARFFSEALTSDSTPDHIRKAAVDYIRKGKRYFKRISKKAHAQWQSLTSPFNEEDDNMDEFIQDDEDDVEEDGDDVKPHAVLYRELDAADEESDENDLAHKIKRKYADPEVGAYKYVESSSSDDEVLEIVDTDSDPGEEDDGLEDLKGYYSPIEEETDDWMKSKLNQLKRTSPSVSKRKKKAIETAIETPVVKTLTRRPSSSTSKSNKVGTPGTGTSSERRTPAIEDSDDDD